MRESTYHMHVWAIMTCFGVGVSLMTYLSGDTAAAVVQALFVPLCIYMFVKERRT